MNKLPIKKLVEYRRMSDRKKVGFTRKIQQPPKPKGKGGGGDYWNRSLSGISTAFKQNDSSIINERLAGLEADLEHTHVRKTRLMYQRNVDLLTGFLGFDFSAWRPSLDLEFLQQPRSQQILMINGLPVQIIPQHIFAFGTSINRQVGGIWFATWQDGFHQSDLGLFAEAIYRNLAEHFSHDYSVNPAACIAVDVSAKRLIGYNQIQNGEVSSQLDNILDDIMSKI